MASGQLQAETEKKERETQDCGPMLRKCLSGQVPWSGHPSEVKGQVPQECEGEAFAEGTAGGPVPGKQVLGTPTNRRDGTRQVRRKEAEGCLCDGQGPVCGGSRRPWEGFGLGVIPMVTGAVRRHPAKKK